jgi:hypothetical protein
VRWGDDRLPLELLGEGWRDLIRRRGRRRGTGEGSIGQGVLLRRGGPRGSGTIRQSKSKTASARVLTRQERDRREHGNTERLEQWAPA